MPRESEFSIGRLLRFVREGRVRRYAVEVDADHAEDFDPLGSEVCDSWENGDGSVVFIVRSPNGVSSLTHTIKGFRTVKLL